MFFANVGKPIVAIIEREWARVNMKCRHKTVQHSPTSLSVLMRLLPAHPGVAYIDTAQNG